MQNNVTVRASGKSHPAIEYFGADGKSQGFAIICNCPGSKNGSLAASARKIADGHQNANCRK